MSELAIESGGAVAGKGMLWAKVDNEAANTITFKKAFFYAFWVELAMVAVFFSIDFSKRWDDIRDSRIMKAVMEAPPPEMKKELPPPPPKEIPKEQPKENVQEAAPVLVDAPVANNSSSSAAVSIPTAVGDVSQGAGTMTEAPKAGPRTSASFTNRNECIAAMRNSYPREARRAGQEGEVMALVTVGPDGRATAVDIREANPRRVFDRAVVNVLANACRYSPDPAGYQVLVPVAYKLSGEAAE